jgi:hypothetical protein
MFTALVILFGGVDCHFCSDPKAWPVATVAASALSTNPQLLIHDGDYHYREAQCCFRCTVAARALECSTGSKKTDKNRRFIASISPTILRGISGGAAADAVLVQVPLQLGCVKAIGNVP